MLWFINNIKELQAQVIELTSQKNALQLQVTDLLQRLEILEGGGGGGGGGGT